MADNDETVYMEDIDNSRKDDQSEFEPNWQGEEDETEDNRHIAATNV